MGGDNRNTMKADNPKSGETADVIDPSKLPPFPKNEYNFGQLKGEAKRVGLKTRNTSPLYRTVQFYEYAREYFRILDTLGLKQLSGLPGGCPGAENLAREIAAELFPVKWVPPKPLTKKFLKEFQEAKTTPIKPKTTSEEQMANTPFFSLAKEKRKKLFDEYSQEISQILSVAYVIKNLAPFLRPINANLAKTNPQVAKRYEEKWQDFQKEVMGKPDPTKAWLMCKVNLYESDKTIKNAVQGTLDKMRHEHQISSSKERVGALQIKAHIEQLGLFRIINYYGTPEKVVRIDKKFKLPSRTLSTWKSANNEAPDRLYRLFGVKNS